MENSPSPQLALPSGESSNSSSISSSHSSPLVSPHPSTDQSLQTTSEISGDRSERACGSLPAGQITSCSFPSSISSKSLKSNGLPLTKATLSEDEGNNLQAFLKAIDQHKLAQPVSNQDKLKILTWLEDIRTTMDDKMLHPMENESPPSAMSGSEFPERGQERIQHLLASRDSLSLKVAMLTKQVEFQREKIHEMEKMLNVRRNGGVNSKQSINDLSSIEPIAQELANLQHKNLALEREKLEAERRLRLSNSELENFVSEQPSLSKAQRSKNGSDTSVNRAELERLRLAIQRLLVDNEQKDSQIQSLRSALDEQRRRAMNGSECFTPPLPSFRNVQQSPDINEQIRRILFNEENGQHFQQNSQQMAHSNSFPLSLCSTVACSSSQQTAPRVHHQQQHSHQHHQQSFPAFMPMSNSFSFAPGSQQQQMTAYTPPLWRVSSPPSIPPHLGHSPKPPASPMARQLAAELDELRRSGAICSGGGIHHHPQYSSSSLPRSIHSKSNSLGSCAPKLAYQQPPNIYGESDDETASRFSTSANNSQQNGSKLIHKKEKRGRRPRSTLRSFLGRFAHRGNSLQDLRPSPRLPSPISFLATNAPTTNFDSSFCLNPPIKQFVEWDGQKCNRWLIGCGFDGFPIDAVHSGRHLLNMSDKDFERDLGIKSALQRKRMKCLLTRIERRTDNGEIEDVDSFDTNQVMIWLDLIGLPQYRDLFACYRMDGRLLLELSAQDLLELGIHSALNHASLARAIQFLRSAEFHLHRMEEHFHADSLSRTPVPTEVKRWSHGCTLGWLCSIDLSEFTQNLAFSGVHGALLVLEPTFTAESLAELLQISVQKTLLRRHLTTQFNTLLGQKVITHKRDVVAQPFVTHLTPSLRIKLARKGVGFSLSRKKSKSDIFVEPEVRVCPAEANGDTCEAITNV